MLHAGPSPYIGCGERDQFNLLYGARRFVRRVIELGVAHLYEPRQPYQCRLPDGTRACFFFAEALST